MLWNNWSLLILFLGLFNLSEAQRLTGTIDLENFDEEAFAEDLTAAINVIRTEEGLSAFVYDKKLQKAALDQAVYNRKFNTVSFEQPNKKKATPFLRTLFYSGLYDKVEEYDLGIEVDVKNKLKTSRKSKNPKTYKELVDYIVAEWKNDKHKRELFKSNALFKIGVGTAPNKYESLVFVTVVLGSEPYAKEKGFSYHKKAYKIHPWDKDACKNIDRNFAYLPELFANNLRFNGRKIQFYYHDLSLIDGLFTSGSDALAVDILLKDQFSCDHGNQQHPSGVHDGMMLKPVKKNKLLKKNTLKDQKEFLADLGQLPASLDTNDVVLDLIVIQNKCACNRIFYNDLQGENIRYLDVDLAVDTISISQKIDSNSRYLAFTVPFEKNKFDYEVEDIKPFLDSIQLNRYNIKEIEIVAFSSIEGNMLSNFRLQERRANSILKAISEYQLQEVKTKIETHENWEGFMESIKGSPYEAQFAALSKEDIRTKVNTDTLDFNLEPYLESQRKADIRIFVESIYVDSLTPEKLPAKFVASLSDSNFIRAKAIQTLMFQAVLEGSLDTSLLFATDIPQYRQFTHLANNRLAFELMFDRGKDRDSLISQLRMDVEALLAIDPGNGHLNYNKQAIKLYYWAKDPNSLIIDEVNHIDEVKDFYKDIRRLYNTKIDNFKVNRLLLNYYIIAADFYYERQDFKNRLRALKQIKRYVQRAQLSREQTLIMARYFIYQMQIDWALEIMHPFLKTGDFDQEFLLTFIHVAVYDEKEVPKELLYSYMQKAVDTDAPSFCKMFDVPGMSVEFLSDLRIKDIYCKTCR